MKALALAGALPLLPGAIRAGTEEQRTPSRSRAVHHILTCNILLDLKEHRGTSLDWALYRRAACVQIIQSRNPDIVCLQETGRGQNEDFIRAFPGFVAFGYPDPYVDTNPRRFQGIKNVILYSRDRYEQTSAGIYWLSETPTIAGSKLPGTDLPRHVTWLRLRDRVSKREFRVLNTHFALEQPIRVQEAKILSAEAAPYAPDFPQILAGDLNADRTSAELNLLMDAGWQDSFESVHGAQEPGSTGHGFVEPAPAAGIVPPGRHGKIDFILFRGQWKSSGAEILREQVEGRFPSDHYFVSADLELSTPAA